MLWHGPRLVRTVFTENTRTEENSEPLGRRKQFRRPYVTDMALELICQPANPSNVSKLCQYETAEHPASPRIPALMSACQATVRLHG